jgi:transcriptional regulator with XRE-family HTH domain
MRTIETFGGLIMDHIGAKLSAIRKKWGLTLRDVEERTARLAQEWGQRSYKISAGWLNRVEQKGRRLSGEKLIMLAAVYGLPTDELLAFRPQGSNNRREFDEVSRPNTTLLLTRGPLEDHARLWLPESVATEPIPDETTLIPRAEHLPHQYRYGIIGLKDKTMYPMLPPGTIVLINPLRRAIAHRREWTNEYDRPIYFLLTRKECLVTWCDLDKNGEWLSSYPHPLSHVAPERWRYPAEVDVIGTVAVLIHRREEPKPSKP